MEKEVQIESQYRSMMRCSRHANCVAVVCAWPVEALEKLWEEKTTCQALLVKEATRCSVCGEQASGLCIYGGHMVCANHSKPWTGKLNRTASPLQCLCDEGKKSPVWPNPFEWMYSSDNSVILEHGDRMEGASFSDDNVLTCVTGTGQQIRRWAYKGDHYPAFEIWNTATGGVERKKRIVAWRLGVEMPKQNEKTHLKRCKNFWFSAACSANLLKIKKFFEVEKEWELFSHERKFFMFAFHRGTGRLGCLNCRQTYTAQLFEKSDCCLFPKAELEAAMRCGGLRYEHVSIYAELSGGQSSDC